MKYFHRESSLFSFSSVIKAFFFPPSGVNRGMPLSIQADSRLFPLSAHFSQFPLSFSKLNTLSPRLLLHSEFPFEFTDQSLPSAVMKRFARKDVFPPEFPPRSRTKFFPLALDRSLPLATQ